MNKARVTIPLNDDYRLLIGKYNWVLQGKNGDGKWCYTTNRYYSGPKWFALGLLKHEIDDSVVAAADILLGIKEAQEKVLLAIHKIPDKFMK